MSSCKKVSREKATKKGWSCQLTGGLACLIVFCVATDVWANGAVYERILRSSVLIVGSEGSGSGAVIDDDRNLVVTNYHVVGNDSTFLVFAPVRKSDGSRWTLEEYIGDAERLAELGYATIGSVVARSKEKDLAILRLSNIPNGLQAMEFADQTPQNGEGLHVVGNPGGRKCFCYSYGGTSYVGQRSWTYSGGHFVNSKVIQFSGHIYFGNSGGPVSNDEGELVGVITGSNETTGTAIAASEISHLLKTVEWREVFSIKNSTNGTVYFSIRTHPDGDWEKESLKPGQYLIWWRSEVSPEISFDWSYQEGYQKESYDLDTKWMLVGEGVTPLRGGAQCYYFGSTNGGIDLYVE